MAPHKFTSGGVPLRGLPGPPVSPQNLVVQTLTAQQLVAQVAGGIFAARCHFDDTEEERHRHVNDAVYDAINVVALAAVTGDLLQAKIAELQAQKQAQQSPQQQAEQAG